MYTYNLVTRALITDNDHILLTRTIEEEHIFLPGGHIESGESITNCLLRELKEELGIIYVNRHDFLGVFECSWGKPTDLKHEINFIFLVKSPKLSISSPVISNEPHIEFFWYPLTSVNEIKILPISIAETIKKWLSNSKPNNLISTI